MVARRVGRVGGDSDAAGGHDGQIGYEPFGPVLADQRDAVARLDSDALERRCERRDLPRGVAPAGRAPGTVALGPEERLIPLLRSPREEHRNETIEMFELPS